MKKKKPGLGALGIDVLLSTGGPAPPAGDASLRTLPVELIHRSPYQPRRQVSPEALEELADSIRRQGILQPVVVRRVEGEYQLIAGERRWRAAQQAGLLEIPAVIRDADDQEAAALALVGKPAARGPEPAGRGQGLLGPGRAVRPHAPGSRGSRGTVPCRG